MLDDLIKEKIYKLEEYKRKADPYPVKVKRTHQINEVLVSFNQLLKNKKNVYLVGRIFSWRDQGKIIFSDLKDETGKIQIVLKYDNLKNFNLLKATVEVGDFFEVKGSVFKTKKGEKSILAKEVRIITKVLRPLPSSFYGLKDIELRLRKRYLDILFNEEVKEIFYKKSIFWQTVRDYLKENGYLEVETPVLELVPGGADAEPFVTYHNALKQNFFLRISLELPLKKLLVAGYEKVFEIGRVFRNEGIDREHLQDYTQMECYAAYWDDEKMMQFVEKLYKKIVKNIFKKSETVYLDKKINWLKKWPRIDFFEIFKKETGLDLNQAELNDLLKKAQELEIPVEKYYGKGRLIDLIYKKTIRPKLIQPVFIVGHPIEISPLAKRDPLNLKKVKRFQILAGGTEIGNGWAELNDPLDQRKRFEEQMKLRELGDKEAQMLNEDFLEALEYGMPPAAGFGMSERFFAILMNRPIRETVIFPLMREEK